MLTGETEMSSSAGLPPRRWQQISAATERVILAGITAAVLVAVIIALTTLGLNDKIDAAAITGVLGGVIGGISATTGASAATRAAARLDSDHKDRAPTTESSGQGSP